MSDRPEELYEKVRRASEAVNVERGRFLAATVLIEHALEYLILHYFRPDEISDFLAWIADPIQLRSRVRIARKIANKVQRLDEWRELFRRIDGVIEDRNRLAHESVWFARGTVDGPLEELQLDFRKGGRIGQSAPSMEMTALVDARVSAEEVALEVNRMVDDLLAHHEPDDTFWRGPTSV